MRVSRIAVVVAALLVLGSCSSPGGTSTGEDTKPPESSVPQTTVPTSASASTDPAEPSTAETPEPTGPQAGSTLDEGERWAAAVPAFEEYWDVINETYAAGGAPAATERMEETMTGGQLEYWEKHFADWLKQERQYEGENHVKWASAPKVAVGSDSGHAEVEFCVDMSDTRAFEEDGTPITKDGYFQEGVAGLEWLDDRWKVAGFTTETAVVDSC